MYGTVQLHTSGGYNNRRNGTKSELYKNWDGTSYIMYCPDFCTVPFRRLSGSCACIAGQSFYTSSDISFSLICSSLAGCVLVAYYVLSLFPEVKNWVQVRKDHLADHFVSSLLNPRTFKQMSTLFSKNLDTAIDRSVRY